MTTLRLVTRELCIAALAVVWFGVGVASVSAQVVVTDGDLSVTFAQVPLFGAPSTVGIAPGAIDSQTVIVQNNSAQTETILLSVANEASTGLADGVSLVVTDGASTTYFSDTFSNFFANVPITLGILPAGGSRTFTLATDFVSSSDNTYQGTTMTFDILFGFASGASVSTGGGGGGGIVTPGTTNTPPDGLVAGAATSSPLFTPPAWWEPVQDFITSSVRGASASVLGYSKGAFGAPSYDEWRAELDAQRAAELAQAELIAASSSTTSAPLATGAASTGTDTWLDRQQAYFSWWILVFLGLVLAGFGWTYRRRGS